MTEHHGGIVSAKLSHRPCCITRPVMICDVSRVLLGTASNVEHWAIVSSLLQINSPQHICRSLIFSALQGDRWELCGSAGAKDAVLQRGVHVNPTRTGARGSGLQPYLYHSVLKLPFSYPKKTVSKRLPHLPVKAKK